MKAIKTLQPIETAPKNTFVLVFGPSGYIGTPLRCAVCKHDAEYRPRNPWVTHSGDAFTDGGEEATHWMPLPYDDNGLPLVQVEQDSDSFFTKGELDHARKAPDILRSLADYHDDKAMEYQSIGHPFTGNPEIERATQLREIAKEVETNEFRF